AEPYRHDALVYFDALSHIDGNIIHLERRTEVIHRDAVDKIADMVAREAVQRQIHSGAEPPRLAYAYPGDTVQCAGDVHARIVQFSSVQRRHVVGLSVDFLYLRETHNFDLLNVPVFRL